MQYAALLQTGNHLQAIATGLALPREDQMGRYTAHLTGEDECQDAISKITDATRVRLTPKTENPGDERAIAAVTPDGMTLGYLEQGHWLAEAMLVDKTPVASHIKEVVPESTKHPHRRILLEVLTGAEASAALARSAKPTSGAEAEDAARANVAAAPAKKVSWLKGCLISVGAFFLLIVVIAIGDPPRKTAPKTSATNAAVPSAAPSTHPDAEASPAASPAAKYQFNEAAMIVQGVDAKEAVKRLLRDPESAQFQDVVGHDVGQGQFVFCGLVNAKNGFGGYNGPRPFVTIGGNIAMIDDGTKDFRKIWREGCTDTSDHTHQAQF